MITTRSIIRGVLTGLILLPLASFAALKDDMVVLDRAYIPALTVTKEGKLDESKRAMDLLNKQWMEFKRKYPAGEGNDKQWQADLVKIDEMIADAGKVVAGGKDLINAHYALEGVRPVMQDMRARSKISYYLDVLREFHDHSLDPITTAAEGKTPATLTDADVAAIRKALPDAEKRWAAVRNMRVDSEFGLSTDQQKRIEKLVGDEVQALQILKRALDGNDKAALIKAAVGIRPAFRDVYTSFGNFEPVRR